MILQTLESEIRMFESVQAGDSVLLVWGDLGSSPDMFQAAVTSVKEAAGECSVVNNRRQIVLFKEGHFTKDVC